MSRVIDLTDRDFTRLLVIKRFENSKRGEARWLCLCDCGNIIAVLGYSLRSGATRSCGCLRREVMVKRATTHGLSHTPEYIVYWLMIGRVFDSSNPAYKNYGGRGIGIDSDWLGLSGFTNFYRDMGPRSSSKHTIERIHNDLGYSKKNCKWATRQEQNGNTRRNRWFYGYGPNGETLIENNQRYAARVFGLDQRGINRCLRRDRNTHRGWKFQYIPKQVYNFNRLQAQ